MAETSPTATSAWIVVAVLIATALAMPAGAATVGEPDTNSDPPGLPATQSGTSPPSSVGTAGPPVVGQLGSTCDYAALYEETIGSVVQVGRGGSGGSGFVYETVGANATSYVLTNQHVVGDAATATVRFRQGEYRTGTVVGRDAYADLAVVRVDGTPDYADALPVADDVPPPGSAVAAIGSPFGLRGTVTHGIVSGVNRSMPTDRGFAVPDVVQTDAPINPGNSGGPLLACDGTVVGVNTAGIQAAVAENVGFAVSSTLIRRVAPALIADGEVAWPYLGVRSTDVTPAVAEANGLEAARGVAVAETVQDGPSAGVLQESGEVRAVDGQPVPVGGDVIVAIDGQRVDTGEDLSSFLATDAAPGDTVALTVVREGEREQVNVTLGERPSPAGGS